MLTAATRAVIVFAVVVISEEVVCVVVFPLGDDLGDGALALGDVFGDITDNDGFCVIIFPRGDVLGAVDETPPED